MFKDQLVRYWARWEPQLKTIVAARASKLSFSNLTFVRVAEGKTIAEVTDPICIFDAPPKGSSKRGGSNKRLVIFITGTFTFEHDDSNFDVVKSSCAIGFFRKEMVNDVLRLNLVDALHFDVEDVSAPTPFHPIFHVQRGLGLDGEACKKVLHNLTHFALEKIEVDMGDTHGSLHNPYFRVPTPQLDLLSVIALIVADYYCSSGEDHRAHSELLFGKVLELLCHSHNVVREGRTSVHLRGKSASAGHLSAALWYPEQKAPAAA